jgi:hypothetical protein
VAGRLGHQVTALKTEVGRGSRMLPCCAMLFLVSSVCTTLLLYFFSPCGSFLKILSLPQNTISSFSFISLFSFLSFPPLFFVLLISFLFSYPSSCPAFSCSLSSIFFSSPFSSLSFYSFLSSSSSSFTSLPLLFTS